MFQTLGKPDCVFLKNETCNPDILLLGVYLPKRADHTLLETPRMPSPPGFCTTSPVLPSLSLQLIVLYFSATRTHGFSFLSTVMAASFLAVNAIYSLTARTFPFPAWTPELGITFAWMSNSISHPNRPGGTLSCSRRSVLPSILQGLHQKPEHFTLTPTSTLSARITGSAFRHVLTTSQF